MAKMSANALSRSRICCPLLCNAKYTRPQSKYKPGADRREANRALSAGASPWQAAAGTWERARMNDSKSMKRLPQKHEAVAPPQAIFRDAPHITAFPAGLVFLQRQAITANTTRLHMGKFSLVA